MPSVGENSFRMVSSRVACDSAPLPSVSQAAVSVTEAPPPEPAPERERGLRPWRS
jgi:hypothetical protein